MIDGYILLAADILAAQRRSYELALRIWANCDTYRTRSKEEAEKKVLRIENELLTDYYHILTFGKVDFKEYINSYRREYGLPERKFDD